MSHPACPQRSRKPGARLPGQTSRSALRTPDRERAHNPIVGTKRGRRCETGQRAAAERTRQEFGGPARYCSLCYWLQIANAVTLTAPEPLTTMVAVACQALAPEGADDWTAARL